MNSKLFIICINFSLLHVGVYAGGYAKESPASTQMFKNMVSSDQGISNSGPSSDQSSFTPNNPSPATTGASLPGPQYPSLSPIGTRPGHSSPGHSCLDPSYYPGGFGSGYFPVSMDFVSRYYGPVATPVVLPDGTLANTPEVAAARAAHLTALQKAKALWFGPLDDGSYNPYKYGDNKYFLPGPTTQPSHYQAALERARLEAALWKAKSRGWN